ncbi:MAG: hypothetical protein OXI81_13220 [Paracoccaceae bacterium]|nr:hypothetical protein [Paracoccaceae bacterium]MDE2912947.1 hypothetical protein [Paracoccaceae bacterium]
MSKMRSAAVLALLIDAMGEHGGHCDRRRLTCAVALLRDAAGVPVRLESGEGPDPSSGREQSLSEQLKAELTAMRSDGLLTAAPGRRFVDGITTTDRCRMIRSRYPRTTERIAHAVRSIARMIAGLSVTEAERLASAWPLLAADGETVSETDGVDRLATGTLDLRMTPGAARDVRNLCRELQAVLSAGQTQAVASSERQIS